MWQSQVLLFQELYRVNKLLIVQLSNGVLRETFWNAGLSFDYLPWHISYNDLVDPIFKQI